MHLVATCSPGAPLLLPLGVAVLEPEATRSAICMAEAGQFASLLGLVVWTGYSQKSKAPTEPIQPLLYFVCWTVL